MRSVLPAAITATVLALTVLPAAHGGDPNNPPLSHGPFPVGFFNTTVPLAGPGGTNAPATGFYPATTGGDGAPADTSLAPYATIVFAPGYQASRLDYWPLLAAFATDGFVALGVDYDPSVFPDTADMSDRVAYALDYLEAENTSVASPLFGMVDGARLVSSGHSMGAGLSVLAAAQHARFDAVLPLSPYILPPLYWPPNLPGDALSTFQLPMQIIVGSADGTAVPALNADVLYANGNCPKSEFTITGADHVFSNPAHQMLLAKYLSAWLHYYLERDGTVFDTLFGSGAQADQAVGLITYDYCLDTAAIDVAPSPSVVILGNTRPFTATVRDRVGTAWNAAVTWSVIGGIGTVDGSGLFTALAVGLGAVVASRDGVNGAAAVTVVPSEWPMIVRAVLTGPGLGDLSLTWSRSANEGPPTGTVAYRVLLATGDPTGPYAQISEIPADGSIFHTLACAGCGHIPGNTTSLFLKVQAVDPSNATRDSNLAARYALAVAAGRTLLAVPLIQDDDALATVLQTVWADLAGAWTYDASDAADPWKAYATAKAGGDLPRLSFGTAFWVDLTKPGQYTVAGLVEMNPTVVLQPGWNLVAYASPVEETIGVSLAGVPGVTRVQTFDPAAPYHLRNVLPNETLVWGEAYWVYTAAGGVWTQG